MTREHIRHTLKPCPFQVGDIVRVRHNPDKPWTSDWPEPEKHLLTGIRLDCGGRFNITIGGDDDSGGTDGFYPEDLILDTRPEAAPVEAGTLADDATLAGALERALTKLSHTPMSMSIAEWSDVCWPMLNAIERLRHPAVSATPDALRSALGEAFETLTYIHAASDCEQSRKAAKEAADKIDAALQQGDKQ